MTNSFSKVLVSGSLISGPITGVGALQHEARDDTSFGAIANVLAVRQEEFVPDETSLVQRGRGNTDHYSPYEKYNSKYKKLRWAIYRKTPVSDDNGFLAEGKYVDYTGQPPLVEHVEDSVIALPCHWATQDESLFKSRNIPGSSRFLQFTASTTQSADTVAACPLLAKRGSGFQKLSELVKQKHFVVQKFSEPGRDFKSPFETKRNVMSWMIYKRNQINSGGFIPHKIKYIGDRSAQQFDANNYKIALPCRWATSEEKLFKPRDYSWKGDRFGDRFKQKNTGKSDEVAACPLVEKKDLTPETEGGHIHQQGPLGRNGFVFSVADQGTQGDRKPTIILAIKMFEQCVLHKCADHVISDVILHVPWFHHASEPKFDEFQNLSAIDFLKYWFQNVAPRKAVTHLNEFPLKYIAAVLHGHGDLPASQDEVQALKLSMRTFETNKDRTAGVVRLIEIRLKPNMPKFKIVVRHGLNVYDTDSHVDVGVLTEIGVRQTQTQYSIAGVGGTVSQWLLTEQERETNSVVLDHGDAYRRQAQKHLNWERTVTQYLDIDYERDLLMMFARRERQCTYHPEARGSLYLPVSALITNDTPMLCWSEDEENIRFLKEFVSEQRKENRRIVVMLISDVCMPGKDFTQDINFPKIIEAMDNMQDISAFVVVGQKSYFEEAAAPLRVQKKLSHVKTSRYMQFEDVHLLSPDLVLSGSGAGSLAALLAQGLVVQPIKGGEYNTPGTDKTSNYKSVVGLDLAPSPLLPELIQVGDIVHWPDPELRISEHQPTYNSDQIMVEFKLEGSSITGKLYSMDSKLKTAVIHVEDFKDFKSNWDALKQKYQLTGKTKSDPGFFVVSDVPVDDLIFYAFGKVIQLETEMSRTFLISKQVKSGQTEEVSIGYDEVHRFLSDSIIRFSDLDDHHMRAMLNVMKDDQRLKHFQSNAKKVAEFMRKESRKTAPYFAQMRFMTNSVDDLLRSESGRSTISHRSHASGN